ncbi:MAG TPA: tetratricopeptide repeat protein [Mycobacteriales bacterium]|nr:tetratricopeptide repeat protein [Mycobacteriales bacterium]
MEFLVLGAVRASSGGRPVNLGTRKQRLVAAVLALAANTQVSTERLIDLLWPHEPPEAPRGRVHTYISGLRTLLDHLDAHRDGVGIDTVASGYLLRCDPHRIDALRFRALLARARSIDDDRGRAELLGQASALWRGDALTGTADEQVRLRLCQDLEEARLAAMEELFEIRSRTGQDAALLDELFAEAGRHPQRPRLTGALMLTLHRAGRTPEALATYQRTQRRLAEELGLDPPRSLRDLHVAILRGDPELAVSSPVRHPSPVPRELPADTAQFTGRGTELARLLALSDRGSTRPTAVVSAIDGMAGIGKTALVVHAAHRLVEHYPDGQVFLDLHGHTVGTAPTDPAWALEALLRSVGVNGGQIPPDLDGRAALWRTRVAGKRALVVLDNVADEGQLIPLLPGTPGCLVLVTSRRRLAGVDGTESLSLDVFPATEAIALFTAAAGPGRLAGTNPGVVEEIVALCGRLPLAVRIAGTRLRHRPNWTADHLLTLLRGEHGPLAALHAGQRSVTAALNLSARHLSGDQRRAYRLLGLYPGPDIEPYATAALLDTDLDAARRLLDDLHDVHLLVEPAPGRYGLHDLVRQHASGLAGGDSEAVRRAAVGRLLDHYAHTAALAADLAYPFEADQRPHIPPPGTPTPDLDTSAVAREWLDTELDNLLAAATADHDRPDRTLHLSAALRRHLRIRARHADALTLHGQALAAARATGDRDGERGALYAVAGIHLAHGRYRQAIECCHQVLASARATGSPAGEMEALDAMGAVHCRLGRLGQAEACYWRSLEIARSIGTRIGEEDALFGLGRVNYLHGRYEQAADYYGQVLRIARSIGTRTGEQAALSSLGAVHLGQGRHGPARSRYQQALAVATEIGDRNGQYEARHGLARTLYASGRYPDALTGHHAALDLATALGQPSDQARAHDGLAHAHRALGRLDRARHHWQAALDILARTGITHTDDPQVTARAVRARLVALDRHGPETA